MRTLQLAAAAWLGLAVWAASFAAPLPDTGQTQSYTPTFGEDSDYAFSSPSYTKLDDRGNELPDQAESWAMVRDNLTGLVWEGKTRDGSIHDRDNLYTWYDSNEETNGGHPGTPAPPDDTESFLRELNEARFGGFSDWRLPTVQELSFLVHHDRWYPAVDERHFPNTAPSIYWTATTDACEPALAWGVDFGYGYEGTNYKLNRRHARAVRGERIPPDVPAPFIDNGDGTVTDIRTGLMWAQRGPESSMRWEQALSYCEGLSFGGYTDWRLPSKTELRSIMDFYRCDPASDPAFFPDMRSAYYWSSTSSVFMPRYGWCIHFGNGIACPSGKSVRRLVRPVRTADPAALWRAGTAGIEIAAQPSARPEAGPGPGSWPGRRAAARGLETVLSPARGSSVRKGLEVIGEGAFPCFSPDGSRIAYTREIANEHYEIFTMRPDGADERCLTCEQPALAGTRWRGQASWHPSGDYLAFTAETDRYPRDLTGTSTRPGVGRNHDVWIMRSDGSAFWKVTDTPDNGGVIRPVFSHDGSLILWNEEFSLDLYPEGKPRDLKIPDDPPDTAGHSGSYWGHLSMVYRRGQETGAWRIRLAEVSFAAGEPRLSNVRSLEPPSGFTLIEAAGFTPSDQGIVASYAPLAENRGQSFWGDIYVVDLRGRLLKRLTSTPFVHDENPVFSPDGRFLLWNAADDETPSRGEELWSLNLATGAKTRLTYFTDPGHPEYDPIAGQITEISWDPSGRRAVFGHVSQAEPGTAHLPSLLWLISF